MIPLDFCKVDEKFLFRSAVGEILIVQHRFYVRHHHCGCQCFHTAVTVYATASVEAFAFFGWLNDRTFVEQVELMGIENVVHQNNLLA
jgi:hypothetical protein